MDSRGRARRFFLSACALIAALFCWLAAPGCRIEADCEEDGCGRSSCGCLTYEQLFARQSEAIANLQAIYQYEAAYYGENGTYTGSFSELYWSPEGDTAYAYFLPDESFQPTVGGPFALPPGVSPQAGSSGFNAVAVGNIDCDDVLDIWIADEKGFVANRVNDVTQ